MKKILIALTIITNAIISKSQVYPSFGPELDVTINGLSFDAMEPFISPDGNYLFFNNLNDGVDTKLFYANKVNDSTFDFIGELNGTNQVVQPYLDAVADLDTLNNFYWTSTRDYPTQLDNLFHGTFNNGNVTNIGRVHGDFNKNIPGWLIMDHGISYDGQFLYYNNARFDGNNCQGVCETELGIAQKVNDSTFNKIINSDIILKNINDTNYNYYAPCISSDNLELYYTRYPRDTITPSTLFEICVAVRNSSIDSFSVPVVLFSELIADLIEAPTLTSDKHIIYYHRKIVGSHKIVMRYRDNTSNINSWNDSKLSVRIYPNPSSGEFTIDFQEVYSGRIQIFNSLGSMIINEQITGQNKVPISFDRSQTYGVCILKLIGENSISNYKLILNR